MDARSEADLVREAQAGDASAFRALCDRHAAAVRAQIEARLSAAVRRKVSALDVYQEALLVAHERLPRFEDRGEGAFRAWLARIAELKAREAVRRFAGAEKRDVGREVTRARRVATDGVAAAGPSPSEAAIGEEKRDEIHRALERLDPDHRRVLELVQGSHLTIQQASVLLGRSTDATKKLYGRAVSRLAEELGMDRRPRP